MVLCMHIADATAIYLVQIAKEPAASFHNTERAYAFYTRGNFFPSAQSIRRLQNCKFRVVIPTRGSGLVFFIKWLFRNKCIFNGFVEKCESLKWFRIKWYRLSRFARLYAAVNICPGFFFYPALFPFSPLPFFFERFQQQKWYYEINRINYGIFLVTFPGVWQTIFHVRTPRNSSPFLIT